MAKRNPTTYRATFSQFRAHAFGIEQIISWQPEIEIYQARVSPELWRARPNMEHGPRKWEAGSAQALMDLINSDFVDNLKPWREWSGSGAVVLKPSLFSPAKEDKRHAG